MSPGRRRWGGLTQRIVITLLATTVFVSLKSFASAQTPCSTFVEDFNICSCYDAGNDLIGVDCNGVSYEDLKEEIMQSAEMRKNITSL